MLHEVIQKIRENLQSKLNETINDSQSVENLRVHFLGKKGEISSLYEKLRELSPEMKKDAGKLINDIKVWAESEITNLKTKVEADALSKTMSQEKIDITLPTQALSPEGSCHPVTLMRMELLNVFRSMGFSVFDGPEIDYDFYNFTALNIGDHHPARDMQDTFYIDDAKEKFLLRTHTSNVQIHTMLQEKPPMRIVAPGRVYRCDSDMTHTPMFHQIEGFVVDVNISMAHLKGVMEYFLKKVFGPQVKIRLRPSYFPFVEPGGEVDMLCVCCNGQGCRTCKSTGWLEVGGCGMIHPNVFEAVNIDYETYSGFAFGFGIDRLAMLKYSLPDLRQLFEGDITFLKQFSI